FRALWLAQVLSVAGDQLARVALTLLVYDRTGSALLAAVTFAASVVPAFLGGVTLSGLADRLPRPRGPIAHGPSPGRAGGGHGGVGDTDRRARRAAVPGDHGRCTVPVRPRRPVPGHPHRGPVRDRDRGHADHDAGRPGFRVRRRRRRGRVLRRPGV